MYLLRIFFTCFFVLVPFSTFSAPISADDFLPPVQAATPEEQKAATDVKQPEAVKQEPAIDGKPATVAATAQDAVNAAVKHIPEAGGCEQIKFPSGFGWVSTGVSVYSVMPNKTATITAQRIAYQKAYLQAKKSLAEALYGLSTSGKEQLASEMKTIVQSDDAAANTKEELSESITESVKGLLRGYVVYNVNDKQEKESGTVSVTIVTTPKTIGKCGRVDASGVSTESMRDGLNHVLTELSSGLLPPVGGKAITVPTTGELAFIGYGSAVVMDNTNAAVRAKLSLEAQKIATMRARSSLCGIILGDDVTAKSSFDEATREVTKQFDDMHKEDPVANDAKDEVLVKKLEEQKVSFLQNSISKEQISSMRSGILPPGVNVKTFFNEDKTIAIAVAIYLPSVSAGAAKSGQDMKNSAIVPQPSSSGNNETTGGAERQQGNMPGRGASGQVTKDADL